MENGDPTQDLPAEWRAGAKDELQLVACETSSTFQPRQACHYTDGVVTYFREKTFEFTVIEAASGRELGRFQVDSRKQGCAGAVPAESDESEFLSDELNGRGLRNGLRQYVEDGHGVDEAHSPR